MSESKNKDKGFSIGYESGKKFCLDNYPQEKSLDGFHIEGRDFCAGFIKGVLETYEIMESQNISKDENISNNEKTI